MERAREIRLYVAGSRKRALLVIPPGKTADAACAFAAPHLELSGSASYHLWDQDARQLASTVDVAKAVPPGGWLTISEAAPRPPKVRRILRRARRPAAILVVLAGLAAAVTYSLMNAPPRQQAAVPSPSPTAANPTPAPGGPDVSTPPAAPKPTPSRTPPHGAAAAPIAPTADNPAEPKPEQPVEEEKAARTPTGTLTVFSSYEVELTVDGKDYGSGGGPRYELPAGPHEVRLRAPASFVDHVAKVDILPGRDSAVRAPVRAYLRIVSVGSCTVTIDGTSVGEAPKTVPVGVGEHLFTYSCSGGSSQARLVVQPHHTRLTAGANFPPVLTPDSPRASRGSRPDHSNGVSHAQSAV